MNKATKIKVQVQNAPNAHLINMIKSSLLIEGDEHTEKVRYIRESIQSLKPRNHIEEMLIAQIVISFNVFAECIQRARLTDDGNVREKELKMAHKFSKHYAESLETLQKYRRQVATYERETDGGLFKLNWPDFSRRILDQAEESERRSRGLDDEEDSKYDE